MSLKTFVKIGKITNLSDARYCAGMMVDVLGFNLDEGTPGYVDRQSFEEITNWVAGVKFAGEFKHASATEIRKAATAYKLDYIEVENIDLLEELQDLNQSLILKQVIASSDDVEKLEAHISHARTLVEFISVECLNPALYEDIRSLLSKLDPLPRIIRSFGLSEANASSIANDPLYHGIELEGTMEERPGFKDYGTVMNILEVLEED